MTDRRTEIETKYLAAKPGTPEHRAYWGDPKGALQEEYRTLIGGKADETEAWRRPSGASGPSFLEDDKSWHGPEATGPLQR